MFAHIIRYLYIVSLSNIDEIFFFVLLLPCCIRYQIRKRAHHIHRVVEVLLFFVYYFFLFLYCCCCGCPRSRHFHRCIDLFCCFSLLYTAILVVAEIILSHVGCFKFSHSLCLFLSFARAHAQQYEH